MQPVLSLAVSMRVVVIRSLLDYLRILGQENQSDRAAPAKNDSFRSWDNCGVNVRLPWISP
jgi:hypothetical protein